MQRWSDTWKQNNNDSINQLLADDVIFLLQGQEYSKQAGRDWVRENSMGMAEFTNNSTVKSGHNRSNSNNTIVYQAGTFSFKSEPKGSTDTNSSMEKKPTFEQKDSANTERTSVETVSDKPGSNPSHKMREKGDVFTFISENQDSNWRVKVIHISQQKIDTSSTTINK